MSLTSQQIRHYRSQAHALKPVVIIGSNGLTEAVQLEIERALEDHELIKIRIHSQDRDFRQQVSQAILAERRAELIQTIGHIITIYRAKQKHS